MKNKVDAFEINSFKTAIGTKIDTTWPSTSPDLTVLDLGNFCKYEICKLIKITVNENYIIVVHKLSLFWIVICSYFFVSKCKKIWESGIEKRLSVQIQKSFAICKKQLLRSNEIGASPRSWLEIPAWIWHFIPTLPLSPHLWTWNWHMSPSVPPHEYITILFIRVHFINSHDKRQKREKKYTDGADFRYSNPLCSLLCFSQNFLLKKKQGDAIHLHHVSLHCIPTLNKKKVWKQNRENFQNFFL